MVKITQCLSVTNNNQKYRKIPGRNITFTAVIIQQKIPIFAPPNLSVAQLVEQLTLNQWVTGSNPVGETNNQPLTKTT